MIYKAFGGEMKKKFLSGNTIKLIALAAMTVDHCAIAFFGINSTSLIYTIMRLIGRMSFPLFIFMIVEGHKHTKCQWKYLVRLLAFWAVSFVPYNLFCGEHAFYFSFKSTQNVFLTLALSQAALMLYDRLNNNERYGMLGYLSAIIIAIITMKVPIFMYSWIGIALTFVIYLSYDIEGYEWIMYPLIALCFTTKYIDVFRSGASFAEFGVLLALPIIYFYNGERGNTRVNKYVNQYFFYSFYPLHLLILWAISRYLI